MFKEATVALAALVVSAAASAQAYGVISAGVSRVDDDCAGTTSCDKTDTAVKLLGGWRFQPNLAAEIGYFDFGKARASVAGASGSIKTTAFGGGIAYHQDLSNEWNFVGRLGLAQVKTKVSISGLGSDSDNNTQLYAGLGVGYKLSKTMSLDAAWDFTRSKYDSSSSNVHALSVGLTFGF